MRIDKSILKIEKLRSFLLKLFSKEFLIFLFFLGLSGGFWLMMTLNETYESEFTVGLRLTNVPKAVILTSEPDSVIRFTVRDKGFVIASYENGKELKPVTINFRQYADGRNRGTIPLTEVQRQLNLQLHKSSKITAYKPLDLDFTFNYGQFKKVPVRMLGEATPGKNYNLAFTRFFPEAVAVYADKHTLDSIQWVYTERLQVANIVEPKEIEVDLRKIPRAKCVPNRVRIKLYPDVLTEETVEVPIESVNLPAGMVLRTFPSKVRVSFIVGAYRLRTMPRNAETRSLLPVGFRVLADYTTTNNGKASQCRLRLDRVPDGLHNAHLVQSTVDYVIEQ